MTNQDYLIQHGWREDRTRAPFKWSDPENRETRYTLENAFEKQAHREAARLHTALAALELAEPLLEGDVKRLTVLYNDWIAFKAPGLKQCEESLRTAATALAAVRAAREGNSNGT